ncbi:GTP 3',8-cyclase MoaA, partial [Pseudomonas sp. MPR-R1B]|uniref:radical SAM protein n=1 Tax=Pseudomonas sp. MPR-R1B TaxID=2070678 RepID=UPI000CB99EB5
VFVEHGVRELRLTGGEPLLRPDLVDVVARLSRLGVDLALTTNGVLFGDHAKALRKAGLSRVTISLDTLRPDRAKAMS